MDHDDDIEGLAAALQASDLARIQTFPPALLLRRDACVPYRGQRIDAAPMACAIDYALHAIHRRPPPLGLPALRAATGDGGSAAPEALATEWVAETPEFAVVDWLLDRFPQQLLDAQLDSTYHDGNTAPSAATQTPLMRTLRALMRPTPYEALALLARLLQRGVALDIEAGGDVDSYSRLIGIDGRRSPLCYAVDVAMSPAGTHAIRMLLAAGARLAPGEAPLTVQRCLTSPLSRVNAQAPAVQLRALLPVYAGRMFETLHEQESVATTWLHHTAASFEVLDTLRLLGLRMDVVHRVAASDAINEVDLRQATIALRRADHASGERAMRTLAVRALAFAPAGADQAAAASSSSWRRARLPLEIVSDIARRASADAPSWQLALGPMDPPLSLLRSGSGSAAAAAIAAADARALAEGERRAYGAP